MNRIFGIATGALVSFTAAGCYIDVDDDPYAYDTYDSTYCHIDSSDTKYCDDPYAHDTADHTYCTIHSSDKKYCDVKTKKSCNEESDIANCDNDNYQSINVIINYKLTENLGRNRTLKIEAFDEPDFSTSPVTSTTVFQFDATKPGTTVREVMHLDSGDYYFRAYLTDEDGNVIPYDYQGMQLVSNSPVGVFGVLGVAKKVTITDCPYTKNDDVLISLDRLFKPYDPKDSDAYIRLKVEVAPDKAVRRKAYLRIELFDRDDFAYEPIESFKVSALSLNQQSGYKTEFVSPQLNTGNFYLRVYIDTSGNGYFDESEPMYSHRIYGELTPVRIIENRTETINVNLKKEHEHESSFCWDDSNHFFSFNT